MHSAWFRSIFLRDLNVVQIREGGHNFWGQPILQKVWMLWAPLLYLYLKSFMDTISSSLVRFQCNLHDSAALFSKSWNFCKLRSGKVISGRNQFCRMSELFGPILLNFNFKSFMEGNFSSFIRLQCIPHVSRVLFSDSSSLYKLKRGKQFCRKSFGSPFCISISKVF